MDKLSVDSLRVDCLSEKPRNYDWSKGYMEEWEVVQPFFYEDFEELEELKGESNEEKTGYYSFYDMQDANAPMTNYYYPLYHRDSFDEEDAKKINHLPLCIVHFIESDTYALALTGGGMDFSWSICEAHIRLGYYPPVHFRLPRMCKHATETNLAIIDACVKGREIVGGWQNRDAEDLERTRADLRPLVDDEA